MDNNKAGAIRRTKWMIIGLEFVVLYVFWILLSGRFEIKYLVIGLFAASITTWFTHDLLYNSRAVKAPVASAGYILSCALRLAGYTIWLIGAIIKANIQVAAIILKPKLDIDPGMLVFSTRLRKKVSLVTLANSITLTPGTVTVDMGNDMYMIHSLVPSSAGDLESGAMQNKVGSVFADNHDPAPACKWTYCAREFEDRSREVEL